MKKILLIVTAIILAVTPMFSQENATATEKDGELVKYRRSSLYSVLIKHSTFPYAEEIDSVFMIMPIPDKFNDHNLSIRSFESSAKKMKKKGKVKDETNFEDTNEFLLENQIAKALVAKWFNRNPSTGSFDMNLIQERGFYDASQIDIANAEQSSRGLSMLGDAGEDLVGNTFLIVNDITFVDKGERSAKAAGLLRIAGAIASQVSGDSSFQQIGDAAAVATNEIDGFTVNITSYLFRLNWDEEIAGTFYNNYWINDGETDPSKKESFENSDIFALQYIGSTTTSARNISSKNLAKKTKGEQMLKVCTRAIDKSVVLLQREYDEFKVNVPIYKISEDGETVEVQIGMKEGINEKSQFEVLMPVEGEDGKIKYDRIGMIQPVKGKIWDNRFGALEEAQEIQDSGEQSTDEESANLESASLTASTFKILRGARQIVPGCLVREVTIKRK